MLKNYPFTDLKLCDIINHNLMTMINNKINQYFFSTNSEQNRLRRNDYYDSSSLGIKGERMIHPSRLLLIDEWSLRTSYIIM